MGFSSALKRSNLIPSNWLRRIFRCDLLMTQHFTSLFWDKLYLGLQTYFTVSCFLVCSDRTETLLPFPMFATFNDLVLLIMSHSIERGLHTLVQAAALQCNCIHFIKKMLVVFHVAHLLGGERKGSTACFRQEGQEQADRPGASYHRSPLLQNILAPASFLF